MQHNEYYHNIEIVKNRKVTYIALAMALVYVALIIGWQLYSPDNDFALQNPGADNRPEGLARKADDVVIGEYFMLYDEDFSSTLSGKWSNFRGENHDNIVADGKSFIEGDFSQEWSFTTGEGHAAPVIYNGRVYVLDYDEQLSSDALRCFSLETGAEIWRRWYRVPMKRNHGFSRTIPVVGDDYVITLGPQGHVMCCHPITGELLWTMDLQKMYGSEIPFWYTGQCPIVDDGIVVFAPAGESVLMVGVDCRSGEVVWETPNSVGYTMSHSSVIPMNIDGSRTYVYAGVGGVCGVSAEKATRGKLLWHTDKWQPSVIAPSPVRVSSSQVLMVAGYGSGGAMIQVNGGVATVVNQYKADKGLACEQQSPILYNGMLITIAPKDGGSIRSKLACYSPSNINTPIWSSAADERFGLGPYMIIDDHLLVFKDDGELYLYKVGQGSMTFVKKQRIMDGVDAWGPMAYADDRLIVRDAHNVVCLKIK